jgi:type IV pilus assembly protein PilW
MFSRSRLTKNRDPRGFTLIELIIAMAIGLIVFASVAATFTSQTRAYTAQEQINQMEQNARGALDIMSREIKMAGYKPNGGTVSGVVSYSSTSLTIQADLDADGAISMDADDYEQISYTYDSASQRISRQVGSAAADTLAENISAFAFTYYQASGTAPATSAADIRRIKISITAKTEKPDPGYSSDGGYRTVDLSGTITPINLGL